jgi:hypothetical protein
VLRTLRTGLTCRQRNYSMTHQKNGSDRRRH